MSKTPFTDLQILSLELNPFVKSVSADRLRLTPEFKDLFLEEFDKGLQAKEIFEKYGFDTNALGNRRIRSLSYHIRKEYSLRAGKNPPDSQAYQKRVEAETLVQLQHEVNYLRQEIEFLKKSHSSRIPRSRCIAHE